jgi:serine/threonine protein kinase
MASSDRSSDDAHTSATQAHLDPPADHAPGATASPDRIGPYTIVDQIGEGGMGVVYLAEQTEPVRRRVALKIIKVGMDTKQVISRFEAERQALALMDHPHVAKVLDAGATETGRPYFVMQHVPGVPITEHCDRHRLSIDERLRLFVQVCEAVQHAHQKGIIHRDLKPSNVLVAFTDAVATPKVIDFGIAKATEQKLTERTVFTEEGQLIGTPEYMSPEQAEMTAQGIDTRTDVYALGVMLYQLLIGSLPFDGRALRAGGLREIQRIIREVAPPRPSTRLGKLAEQEIAATARDRSSDRRTLLGVLNGDLDWVVMKAMEKDRARRYASVSELAADVRRHLEGRPVEAAPPSLWYRTKCTLLRHAAVLNIVNFLVVVILGFQLLIGFQSFGGILIVIGKAALSAGILAALVLSIVLWRLEPRNRLATWNGIWATCLLLIYGAVMTMVLLRGDSLSGSADGGVGTTAADTAPLPDANEEP